MTDANLVLGRLSDATPLAGDVALRADLARSALAAITHAFPTLDEAAAADGIVAIAVARMVSAIKEISVSRGHDPRDFALVAYGGAGPMHAALVAAELEIGHVVVPPGPGNFSAFGALISDIRHDHVQTRLIDLDDAPIAAVGDAVAELEASAKAALSAEGMPAERIACRRACGMRYVGQSWDLIVAMPDDFTTLDDLAERFHATHERRFGYRTDDAVEIVSIRVSAIGAVERPDLPECPADGTVEAARTGARPVVFDRAVCETAIYQRERLPRDGAFDGPALVEEMGALTVVPPGWRARVGRYGELHLERAEDE